MGNSGFRPGGGGRASGPGRLTIVVLIITALAMLLAACGQGGGGSPQEQPGNGEQVNAAGRGRPIKIGVVLSITGHAGAQGEAARNAVDLLRDEFVQAGGRPLEWVVYDDATDAGTARAAVERAIIHDGAAAVICCSTSHNTMAVLSIIEDHGVPLLTLSPVLPPVRQEDGPADEGQQEGNRPADWVFQIPPGEEVLMEIIAQHMAGTGVAKAAFLGVNDERADQVQAAFVAAMAAHEIERAAMEHFRRGDEDLEAQLTAVSLAGAEALVLWAPGASAENVHRQLRELGMAMPVYHAHGEAGGPLPAPGEPLLATTFVPVGKLTMASHLAEDDPQRERVVPFRTRYENRFGAGSVNSFSGYAHDAMLLVSTALAEVLAEPGTATNPGTLRPLVRDALAQLEDVPGVSGVFTFSPSDESHRGLDGRAAVLVGVGRTGWEPVQ